jgi:hypothetical protein
LKMELGKIIEQMEKGMAASPKTASAVETAPATTDAALKQSLVHVLEAATEKTAAEAQPTSALGGLKKMAADLAGTEKSAEIAHMQVCGAAFADAAVAKMAMYEAQIQQKTAAVQEPMIAGALASVDDATLKTAAEQGYADTVEAIQQTKQAELQELEKAASAGNVEAQNVLQKVAEEEFQAGQNSALNEVHNLAADQFIKGAQEVTVLLDRLGQ